jgi:hypothetical protein
MENESCSEEQVCVPTDEGDPTTTPAEEEPCKSTEDCAEGLVCRGLWAQEGEEQRIQICTTRVSTPCAPCEKDSDCLIFGDRCMDPGQTGSTYCLVECGDGTPECDEGSSCTAVDGDASVCVPNAGVCACEVGDVRVCSVVGPDGAVCTGDLVCTADLEWVCTARAPTPEICGNDSDDDCDGETDEDCP